MQDMLSAVAGTTTGTITQHDAEHARGKTACHLVHWKESAQQQFSAISAVHMEQILLLERKFDA